MEAAMVSHPILGPQPLDDLKAFVEEVAAVVHVHVEGIELPGDEGAAKADIEAPIAHVVEHRKLSRELDGMVEGRYHGAGDGTQALGACCDSRKHNDGAGGVAAIVMEVVLDAFGRGVAQLVAPLAEP